MPIQAHNFNRGIVFGREVISLHAEINPSEQRNSDQNVEGVNASQKEVDREEHVRVGPFNAGEGVPFAGKLSYVEFVGVFKVLDHQEHKRKCDRCDQIDHAAFLFAQLHITNGQGNCEGADNQHDRVDPTKCNVQLLVSIDEHFVMPVAEDRVRHEYATEQKNFGQKK